MDQTNGADQASTQDSDASPAGIQDWPVVETDLPADAVLGVARGMSKRGELPGFTESGPGLFSFDAYGKPFERSAHAHLEGGRLWFTSSVKRTAPVVLVVCIVVSIWPGLWLTGDLLDTYSDWYASNVETWWWYVPLLVLGLLPLPKMWKASKSQAAEDGLKNIEKISEALKKG